MSNSSRVARSIGRKIQSPCAQSLGVLANPCRGARGPLMCLGDCQTPNSSSMWAVLVPETRTAKRRLEPTENPAFLTSPK